MPRLIVLNGPPGCGKSTLAQRYADEHPLTLNLDIDRLRDLISGWRTESNASGTLARAAALAAAGTHLSAGHDVVVPQFLGRTEFLERLAALADRTGVEFHEIVLLDSRANALRRFAARPTSPRVDPHELGLMYDNLLAVIAARPGVKVVPSVDGEANRAYQDLLARLGG